MIKDNILEVRKRISAACLRAKREPVSVQLIAVSKNSSIEEIKEAISAGITEFGENRVQEAVVKFKELTANGQRPTTIKWHMLGHLQTNKAKEAVRIFELIHSVDSLRLAEEIAKQAAKINKIQDILIEIKTSPEAAKFGIKPDELSGFIKEIAGLRNINIKGLMTIAPLVSNPEDTRPYFRTLRELRDSINQSSVFGFPSSVLSMGMTDDFEIAIEEGADIVRIGRAIFE